MVIHLDSAFFWNIFFVSLACIYVRRRHHLAACVCETGLHKHELKVWACENSIGQLI